MAGSPATEESATASTPTTTPATAKIVDAPTSTTTEAVTSAVSGTAITAADGSASKHIGNGHTTTAPTTGTTSGRRRRKPQREIIINPTGDLILTILFFLASVWLVHGLWTQEGPQSVALLAALFGATAVTIRLVRSGFVFWGGILSRTLLKGPPFNNPLKKDIGMAKFADQGWQLVQHVSSSICAYLLMTQSAPTAGGAWGWLGALKECFNPCPLDKVPTEAERWYYLVQLAIWMYSAFSQKFLQKKAKDYFIMYGHHVATLALVTGSYLGGNTRIGIVILFIHDISDISIDLLKMTNYARLAGPKAFFLVEQSMVLTLVCWVYFRLYLFPFHVLPSTLWDSHDLCSAPEHRGDYLYHDPPGMRMWRLANVLLTILCIMHAYWFSLLLKIVRAAVFREDLHATASKEYEGGSDDEHDD